MKVGNLKQGDHVILRAPNMWLGSDTVEAIFMGYASHKARMVDIQALLSKLDSLTPFVVFEICHGVTSNQHVYAPFAVLSDGTICDPRSTNLPVAIERKQ